jgi:hypothetical protein
MNNNSLLNFAYGDHLIRSQQTPAGPLFVIADLCEVLELSNPTMACRGLHEDDLSSIEVIDSLGRIQHANACNESGLYQLIFQSRKKAAKAFTRWVTSEVLPAIRRTGSYSPAHQAFLALIREQIALGVSPDLAARMAGRLVPQEKPAARALLDSRPHPHDAEIDEILSHLQPEASYTIPTVIAALPSGHRLRRGSAAAQSSAVGKVLSRAVRQQRLERDPDFPRTATFRLPQVVAFSVSQ